MSHTDAAPSSKSALRAGALARRAAMTSDERAVAALAIAARANAVIAVLKPRSVAGYLPIRSECDPRPILDKAEAAGLTVALPAIVDKHTIVFRRHIPGTPMTPGAFGTSHPHSEAPLIDPEMIIVPVVGFDRSGARLGHGRGFYDRAIAALRARGLSPRLLGVAFAVQEVSGLIAEPHDVRLDWIVTEKETLDFRRKGG